MRDIELGTTFDVKFTTTEPDTGAPATLGGSPVVSAYVGNSTTQITAGITLTVDFDGVTGLHNVRVVATSGNGYSENTDVALVITTGTVDGNSAVGYVIEQYTIGRSGAYRRLGAPAGASVSADIAAIESQTDDIGAAGAGLTAIPWNSSWDAEVQSAIGLASANLDTQLSGLDGKLDTIDNFLDTEVAAILADTNEMQTDWADGGRLDLILDSRASQSSVDTIDDFIDTEIAAIKEKTDSLTFTVAGQVDANIQSINDVTITGNGQTGTEFGV